MEMKKSEYPILMITINNAWKHGNIGIDQLTGFLREKDFNVDIAYLRTRDTVESIFHKIKDDYLFYGFSVTSANISMCYELAERLKKYRSNVVVDFGGGYATRYYREIFLYSNYVDFITLGDGEHPTEYLLNKLISDSDYICAEETGHFAVASARDCENKNQYINTTITHFPAFDYYEYDTVVRNTRKVHCIQTKNNICTGNCTFCTERHGKVCYKDISQIIEQIKYVYIKYGVKKIFFTDDNIFDPNDNLGKEHVRQLCHELLKLKTELNFKIVYQCYMKANSLKDTLKDNELLQLMKDVGFVEVFVGIESGNDSDLKLYNKHTTVNDNYVIIDMLKKHGLFPIMGFIAYNPYTTFEKIEDNFKFLCDVECTYLPNYLYSFVNINKYTAIYDMAKRDGLIVSSDDEYINIKYKYVDETVEPILRYVESEMLARLKEIQYETDWIIYSYMEHKILYNIDDLSEELNEIREKDFDVIKKYLSILFVEHNIEKFRKVEEEFWGHFLEQQERIKNIYQYLISQHTCMSLYAKGLKVNSDFEERKCNDILVGEYCDGLLTCYFDKKSRILHQHELDIAKEYEGKTIVIVLESPHICEYDDDFVSPALGVTGNNLGKWFSDILTTVPLEGKYRIILMNSIQYQCSLGRNTKQYRDAMWLKLWFKERLKENFKKRLHSYSPDIIFNLCTCGGHRLEENVPNGCKSVINQKYINKCISPHKFQGTSTTTLRKLVSDAILELDIEAILFEGNHPASWKISEHATLEQKTKKFNLKRCDGAQSAVRRVPDRY